MFDSLPENEKEMVIKAVDHINACLCDRIRIFTFNTAAPQAVVICIMNLFRAERWSVVCENGTMVFESGIKKSDDNKPADLSTGIRPVSMP